MQLLSDLLFDFYPHLNLLLALILCLMLAVKSRKLTNATIELQKEKLKLEQNCFYIIVLHFWFVDSKSFDIIYSEAKTYADAHKEALVIQEERNSTFNKCAFKVVPIYH